MKQSIIPLVPKKSTFSKTTPSRLWFMSKGYDPIDPTLVFGRIFYIRVKNQEVSILNANGRKGYIEIAPNEKASINAGHTNPYMYLKFKVNGRTRHVPVSLLVMATYNHKVPDRKKKQVIDHIDGNTLNNNPRNLRIISDAINRRDGGFLKKLRNNKFIVAVHPPCVILAGYENMARWKEEHSKRQYENLRGKELLRVFFGPKFTVMDPDIIMDLEPLKHI